MFGDASIDAFAPEAKTGRLQLAAHDRDDIPFDEACALLDFLEACPVLPRQAHDAGNLFGQKRGFH